jgi:hypothetical protein
MSGPSNEPQQPLGSSGANEEAASLGGSETSFIGATSGSGTVTPRFSTHFPILPDTPADANDFCKSQGIFSGTSKKKSDQSFHTETTLASGRNAVMLDTGSVGNLAGQDWLVEQARQAMQAGRKPEQIKRDRPLSISGVGTGSQKCHHNCNVPCAVKTEKGFMKGSFKSPCVPNSPLPALLGLSSLRESRGIIDTSTNRLYLVGPGDYDLGKLLPPGTACVQCEYSPSGHMMMPVNYFTELDQTEREGGLELKEVVLPVNRTQG